METDAFKTYKKQAAALSLQYTKDKDALLAKYTANKAKIWTEYMDELEKTKQPVAGKSELIPQQQPKQEAQPENDIMTGWRTV